MRISSVAKAIIAALVAGLGSLELALADDVIVNNEWVKVASVTLAAFWLVWGVPNMPVKAPNSHSEGV